VADDPGDARGTDPAALAEAGGSRLEREAHEVAKGREPKDDARSFGEPKFYEFVPAEGAEVVG
jgi:hypothetical protein